MTGNLIYREELEKALSMLGRMYIDGVADDKAYLPEQRVYEVLRNIPAVEAEPVVYAHWFEDEEGLLKNIVYCSACRCGDSSVRSPRCRYCGAHMLEELRTCYCPICDKHFEVRSNDSMGNCPNCGHHVVLHRVEVDDGKVR